MPVPEPSVRDLTHDDLMKVGDCVSVTMTRTTQMRYIDPSKKCSKTMMLLTMTTMVVVAAVTRNGADGHHNEPDVDPVHAMAPSIGVHCSPRTEGTNADSAVTLISP